MYLSDCCVACKRRQNLGGGFWDKIENLVEKSGVKKALKATSPTHHLLTNVYGQTREERERGFFRRAERFGKLQDKLEPEHKDTKRLKFILMPSASKVLDEVGRLRARVGTNDKIERWISPAGWLHRPGGPMNPHRTSAPALAVDASEFTAPTDFPATVPVVEQVPVTRQQSPLPLVAAAGAALWYLLG